MLTPPAGRTSHSPVWLSLALTALFAAALGAGGTYLALRPALARVAILQAAVNAQAASQGPATAPGVPPPNLTVGLDPAHAALNLGNWYEDHQDWPHAIANYALAIADGLDGPDVRTDLGVAYYKSGQPQKALEQYQNAQTQNPWHENSLFNQGAALFAQNKPLQAINVWQTYLRRFPRGQHVADTHQLIGEVKAHGASDPLRSR